jgi:hypothetical protein
VWCDGVRGARPGIWTDASNKDGQTVTRLVHGHSEPAEAKACAEVAFTCPQKLVIPLCPDGNSNSHAQIGRRHADAFFLSGCSQA